MKRLFIGYESSAEKNFGAKYRNSTNLHKRLSCLARQEGFGQTFYLNNQSEITKFEHTMRQVIHICNIYKIRALQKSA